MGFLEKLEEFFLKLMAQTAIDNLSGAFSTYNEAMTEAAQQASFIPNSPTALFASVPAVLEAISQSVMIPIAGIILAGVLTWEFFQMIIERNNFHDVDGAMFFRWILKAFLAVVVVTYAHTAVNAFFEVGAWMSEQAAATAAVSGAGLVPEDLFSSVDEQQLIDLGWGSLFMLLLASLFLKLSFWAIGIIVTIVMIGRIIEIYLVASLAPIPMASMVNRNWGVAQSYVKRVVSLAVQGFFIVLLLAIFKGLLDGWVAELTSVSPEGLATSLWKIQGYFFVVATALFMTKSTAKSIVGVN